MWFFPLGIADVRRGGGGAHVHLTCGCVMVYIGLWTKLTRRGLLTVCWEHDGYWPIVDAARWAFAGEAQQN